MIAWARGCDCVEFTGPTWGEWVLVGVLALVLAFLLWWYR